MFNKLFKTMPSADEVRKVTGELNETNSKKAIDNYYKMVLDIIEESVIEGKYYTNLPSPPLQNYEVIINDLRSLGYLVSNSHRGGTPICISWSKNRITAKDINIALDTKKNI